MKKLILTIQEFTTVKALLIYEGIQFTQKVAQGMIHMSVPEFFANKYGY